MKTNFSKISIPFNSLEAVKVKHLISSGIHSSLYSTKSPEYLVKFISLEDPKSHFYNQNEQYLYLHLDRHPNLASTHCYKDLIIKEKHYGCYLIENCPNGSLSDLITSLKNSISETLILEMMYQITLGLAQLHNRTPSITYRSLALEKVLIGSDGKLKLCDFGHCTTSQIIEIRENDREFLQIEIDEGTHEKYRAPELCDLYSQLPISKDSDIWALGCLLYYVCYKKFPFEGKLAIINNHYVIPKQPLYSEKITNLFKKIFVTKPKDRITAAGILEYIQFENKGHISGEFTFNKNLAQTKKNELLLGNKSVNIEKKQKNVKPKFMDLMNKHFKRLTTKSEGWLLSALEENEEGPNQKYVRYLIMKAWKKDEKIVKFYRFLQKHDHKNIDNCVIIMKSLIVLHNYFKKGPPEALKVKNKEGNPNDILLEINRIWKKFSEEKSLSTKDKKRTPYISSLIHKFSSILVRKLKLNENYANYFEGNYAMTPFFKAPKNAPISLALIEDLLLFLTMLQDFNQCLLNENALWRVQMSLVLSVIDEEYCLISILTHLIAALRKASNFIDGKVKEDKLRSLIEGVMEKFEKNFKNIRIFFLNCKNIKDFEQKELIPALRLEVLEALAGIEIMKGEQGKRYNILQDLNNEKSIYEITLPQCYGIAIKGIQVNEMIGLYYFLRIIYKLIFDKTIIILTVKIIF